MNYQISDDVRKRRRKELQVLHEILESGEKLKIAVSGRVEPVSVLFAVTDKRAIAIAKTSPFSTMVMDYPLEIIQNISYKKGFLYSSLFFKHKGGFECITSIANFEIDLVVQALSKARDSVLSAGNTHSVADEIRKFKSLLDDGIITQEEFQKKKHELLQ